MEKQNMNTQNIWNIRDARGLNANEKVFLYTVASRGAAMITKWNRTAQDMGFSKATFYRTREAVLNKNLLKATRRTDDTTVYSINEDVLRSYVPTPQSHIETGESHIENAQSHIETPESHIENGESHIAETKVTKKVTKKETMKGTKKDAAGASSNDKSQEVREDRTDEQPSSNSGDTPKDLPNTQQPTPPSNSPTPGASSNKGTRGAAQSHIETEVFAGVTDEECKEEAIRMGVSNSYRSHRDAKFPPKMALRLAMQFSGLSA